MKVLKILVYGLLLLAVLPLVSAQEMESPAFALVSEDPVIEHGSSGEWDGRYTDPGAALYHDGQFHMFRNGFKGWPASVQIGYLTSPDGITWTEVSEEPVLLTDEVPYAEVAALASSALVEEDGTWVLYFYTWNSFQGRAPGEIGRATASDPAGTWTVDPEPVLRPGSEGSWDDHNVTAPSVIKTEDGYRMYFSASSNDSTRSPGIGLAFSEDGITWTKYDDPATTDAPFAESDPILVAELEEGFWHQPRVEQTEDGLIMILREGNMRGEMKLYYATSTDGIEWEVVTEPILQAGDVPSGRGRFWYTATAYHEGTVYLYVEVEVGSGTSIFALTGSDMMAN